MTGKLEASRHGHGAPVANRRYSRQSCLRYGKSSPSPDSAVTSQQKIDLPGAFTIHPLELKLDERVGQWHAVGCELNVSASHN